MGDDISIMVGHKIKAVERSVDAPIIKAVVDDVLMINLILYGDYISYAILIRNK